MKTKKYHWVHLESPSCSLVKVWQKSTALGLSEAQSTNAGGARDIYLQAVKKKISQDSNLINNVVMFYILEEEYILLRQDFSNWAVFRGLTLEQQNARMKN